MLVLETQIYEKVSSWLALLVVTIASAWLALVRKMNSNRFETLETSCADILDKISNHDSKLSAHDLHLSENTIKLENLQTDITQIKDSVDTINDNIKDRNEVLNGKLDRLLER